MRRSVPALLAGVLLTASGALAQSGPSFDCAKATSEVEKTICRHRLLGEADRKMAGAYAALHGTLSGAARVHLATDQSRWLAATPRTCVDSHRAVLPKSDVEEAVRDCVRDRLAARADLLAGLPTGAGYPFIAEQGLVEFGRVGEIAYRFVASWPRFEAPGIDYRGANARAADGPRREIAESKPPDDVSPVMGARWSYDSSHAVTFPVPGVANVAIRMDAYLGGSRGIANESAMLVDLASGRLLGLDDVLDGDWLGLATALCIADLRGQIPASDPDEPGLTDAGMRKLLVDAAIWMFRDTGVSVFFNRYTVAPGAAGSFSVDLTWDQLKPVIRRDGPLGSRAR